MRRRDGGLVWERLTKGPVGPPRDEARTDLGLLLGGGVDGRGAGVAVGEEGALGGAGDVEEEGRGEEGGEEVREESVGGLVMG